MMMLQFLLPQHNYGHYDGVAASSSTARSILKFLLRWSGVACISKAYGKRGAGGRIPADAALVFQLLRRSTELGFVTLQPNLILVCDLKQHKHFRGHRT